MASVWNHSTAALGLRATQGHGFIPHSTISTGVPSQKQTHTSPKIPSTVAGHKNQGKESGDDNEGDEQDLGDLTTSTAKE